MVNVSCCVVEVKGLFVILGELFMVLGNNCVFINGKNILLFDVINGILFFKYLWCLLVESWGKININGFWFIWLICV